MHVLSTEVSPSIYIAGHEQPSTGFGRPARTPRVAEAPIRSSRHVAALTLGDFAATEQLLPTPDQVRIGKLTGDDFVLLGLRI
jgi:hypothetical protein